MLPAIPHRLQNDRPVKVSVIVPVYNAGHRIYKCLDTLVNQTLREIEIICVLDCPTDGTDKVVEDYALKDDRIVIVRNERNLHVSESRNEGLKVARGEYIGFSDHDDYRELYMYEQLYRKAKEADADVVVSDVKVVNEDRSVEICCFKDTTKFGFANSVLLPMHHENNVNQLSKSVWHSIYRNDFLQKYNIRFESREEFFEEDTLFNLKSCLLANSIGYVSMVLYCWDKHIDSESNRIFPHHVLVRRQLNSLIYIADFLKDNVFF